MEGALPPNLDSIVTSNAPLWMVEPGVYTIKEPVPIGVTLVFSASSPYGNNPAGQIVSYAWDGGTPYDSYFASAAGSAPPASVSLGISGSRTDSRYVFIVDSTPRTYSIEVEVSYAQMGEGVSVVTFTSDAPTGSIGLFKLGTQAGGTVTNPPPGYSIVGLQPGIYFNFKVSSDSYTSGTIMLMQVINTTMRQYSPDQNSTHTKANDASLPAFDGPLLDDSPVSQGGTSLGYGFYYPAGVSVTSYMLGTNAAIPSGTLAPPQTSDAPSQRGLLN